MNTKPEGLHVVRHPDEWIVRDGGAVLGTVERNHYGNGYVFWPADEPLDGTQLAFVIALINNPDAGHMGPS